MRYGFSVLCAMIIIVSSAQSVLGQEDVPTKGEICDTLAAYRAKWQTFDATYTVNSPLLKMTHTDIFAYDAGRIYIERTTQNKSGKGLSNEHYIMCFDGENTYSVTPRKEDPDLVGIMPGFDRQFVDTEAGRCVLGAWMFEFKRPLDEVLCDPEWETAQLRIGQLIDGKPTVYLELVQQANVRMVMRYWLASDMDYLPIRRQLLIDDGQGEQLINEYRVTRFDWFYDGWFPMEMEWSAGGTLISTMKITKLGRELGAFDAFFATMVSPPANVTDMVHDEVYKLVSDEQFFDMGAIEVDETASKRLADFLDGVEPEIAEQVRLDTAKYKQRRAMEKSLANPSSPNRFWSLVSWLGGGAVALAVIGGAAWWYTRRKQGV